MLDLVRCSSLPALAGQHIHIEKIYVLLLLLGTGLVSATIRAAEHATEPICPIPLKQHLDPRKVELGRALFNSHQLSQRSQLSCASCHNLTHLGGADGSRLSRGIDGKQGIRNTPTVFNTGLLFTQFWDGRATTLNQQVNIVVYNPNGMATNWPDILKSLSAQGNWVSRFQTVYADGITAANVQDSLAEYMRSLNTPNSRFDRYLTGDNQAISTDELKGYHLFKDHGCISCHQGVNLGGNMFQVFGIIGQPGDYFRSHGGVTKSDLGRFNITHDPADQFVFRVPSLRNVALTAPYLNDGSASTLEEAVEIMAQYQLGRSISTSDTEQIVKFLKTLTGEYQGHLLTSKSEEARNSK